MSFTSGTVTFTRYAVRGRKPAVFTDEHLDRLRDRAAGTAKLAAASGTETGWAAGGHVLDTDFTPEKNIYPDHLAFDFWTQTDKLPPDRLKAYYEIDLKALVAESPFGRATPKLKRLAKESARERIEKEAKDGRFKKQKCVPVLWDAVRNEVLVGTTSEAALDRFRPLFVNTFEAHLFEPKAHASALGDRTAAALATDLDPKAKDAVLSKFAGDWAADACRWAAFDDRPDFLGNEFLLWLWAKLDRDEDEVRVKDGSGVSFWFAGGVRLEHPTNMDNDTINAESAVRKPQARKAVQTGYLPRKAAITLVRHGNAYTFKLNAETLAVTALKLPPVDDKITHPRERIVERLAQVREFTQTLDLLYQHFVSLRLSSMWQHEVTDIREWLGADVRSAA